LGGEVFRVGLRAGDRRVRQLLELTLELVLEFAFELGRHGSGKRAGGRSADCSGEQRSGRLGDDPQNGCGLAQQPGEVAEELLAFVLVLPFLLVLVFAFTVAAAEERPRDPTEGAEKLLAFVFPLLLVFVFVFVFAFTVAAAEERPRDPTESAEKLLALVLSLEL
jgi:hypothetical protein